MIRAMLAAGAIAVVGLAGPAAAAATGPAATRPPAATGPAATTRPAAVPRPVTTWPAAVPRPVTTWPAAVPRPVTTWPAAVPRPVTDLVLSYAADAGYAAAVTLTCDPPGGAHPKPARACATLAKVHGKPNRLKPTPAMCTLEFAPITAEITGTWRGKPVAWKKTFGNHCDLARATGKLFAF